MELIQSKSVSSKIPEGYSDEGEIAKRGIIQILKNVLPYILFALMGIAGFFIY
jgi:hypothetical protein